MKILPTISLAVSLSLLTACGGGGGGGGNSQPGAGSSSSSATENNAGESSTTYTPDGSLLLEAATASSELYVEPAFDFQTSNSIMLYITAVNADNAPIEYSRISIYLVPDSITDWNDELMDQAELLTSGITDLNGVFSRQLDVPDYGTQLLLVLDAMGFENKQLVAINSMTVTHHFN